MTRWPAALALALALSVGCSGTPSGGTRGVPAAPEVSEERNRTDVAYAHELTTMQQQAVDMVAMVANKDVSPGLRSVAAEIGRARVDEIEELRELLRAWRIRPHGTDFHGNPGEQTFAQLSELYALDGAAFEELWLDRMVANHEGAVAMSRAELADGLNLDARELARGLVELQERQVGDLTALLRP